MWRGIESQLLYGEQHAVIAVVTPTWSYVVAGFWQYIVPCTCKCGSRTSSFGISSFIYKDVSTNYKKLCCRLDEPFNAEFMKLLCLGSFQDYCT